MIGLGVVTVLALVATACSSSESPDEDETTTTVAQATGTPLLIGYVGSETSPTGGVNTQGSDALKTWVSWANDNGGINGHPVKAFYRDDKSDPATSLAAVKELVEQDGVIALVSPGPQNEQIWADYVKTKNLPVIHSSLNDSLWFTNPMFYPLGGTVISNIWGQMKAASVHGAKTVAIVLCTEVPACAQSLPLYADDAKAVGLNPVHSSLAPRTQSSYTAECLAAKSSGAEAMAVLVDMVAFSRDCGQQNFHPVYISSAMGPTADIIKNAPELGNIVGSSPAFLCLDTSIPAAKDFNTALKRYHPEYAPGGSKRQHVTDAICNSWVGGVGFAKAITNANVPADATATTADVIRGLSMFKGETLGGLEPPITLSDGTRANPEAKCVFLYRWKAGVFSSMPSPGAYTCQP